MERPSRARNSFQSLEPQKYSLVLGLVVGGFALWIVSITAASEPRPSVAGDARDAVVKVIPLLQSSAKTWHEKQQCSSCHHQFLSIATMVIARDRGFKIDEAMFADEVQRSALRESLRDSLLLGEVSINEQILC